jgi:hypothetical protein
MYRDFFKQENFKNWSEGVDIIHCTAVQAMASNLTDFYLMMI